MKVVVQNKVITESFKQKWAKAKQSAKQCDYPQAIKHYTRCLFLKEEPACLVQLAQIYQKIMDYSTALSLHKRAQQLGTHQNPRIKQIALIKGYGLLDSGSANNILQDTEFKQFANAYPAFHIRILQLAYARNWSKLLDCLAFLETDYRVFALQQLEVCINQNSAEGGGQLVELLILQAFIKWSLMKKAEGFKLFWKAEQISNKQPLVQIFLEMVTPKLEAIYREAQCLLIDGKGDKCALVIRKGLEMHPTHTKLLIAKAYLHRSREQYEEALCDLELANKSLRDTSLESDLRNQIALTYNEMGTFLFKKGKYTEAIALFNQGIAFKSTDWGMRANRGDCYKALNEYGKALDDYIAAHNLSGDNQDINLRLGMVYNSRGIAQFNNRSFRQAIMQFTQAIKYCKKVSQFYLNRAKALVEIDKLPEAVLDFESAAKIDPQNTEATNALKMYKQEQTTASGAPKKKIIYLSNQK